MAALSEEGKGPVHAAPFTCKTLEWSKVMKSYCSTWYTPRALCVGFYMQTSFRSCKAVSPTPMCIRKEKEETPGI